MLFELLFVMFMPALPCPVEGAHYTLRTAPDVTARFEDVDSGREWPSHIALAVHFAKTERTYWFLPWNGGSDDRQNLASTTDVLAPGWRPPSPDGGPRPSGDMSYIATDAAYTVIDAPPHKDGAAPVHMLLPELGSSVWHAGLEPRDGAPKQFFDLAGCFGKNR